MGTIWLWDTFSRPEYWTSLVFRWSLHASALFFGSQVPKNSTCLELVSTFNFTLSCGQDTPTVCFNFHPRSIFSTKSSSSNSNSDLLARSMQRAWWVQASTPLAWGALTAAWATFLALQSALHQQPSHRLHHKQQSTRQEEPWTDLKSTGHHLLLFHLR
jgi:hypothetical protein